MDIQIKQCQNCHNNFQIEPDDFEFYDKIKVPAPTFCPECRRTRKIIWRNEINLYKHICAKCKQNILSSYPENSGYVVYCQKCWWGDDWGGEEYAKEYDFSKPFFAQFKELMREVPRWNVSITNCQNSDYCNFAVNDKNCYLSRSVLDSENIFYSNRIDKSKDCFDCTTVANSEFSYECYFSQKIYHSMYLMNCRECIDSAFLFNCINCKNCFMSSNLRNGEYIFGNNQLNKEGYFKAVNDFFNNGGYAATAEALKKFGELRQKSLRKYAEINKCVNSTGDNLYNSKNAEGCFDGSGLENTKYLFRAIPTKDSMDCTFIGGEQMYESASPSHGSGKHKFCQEAFDSLEVEYCNVSKNLSNCFGCVGLKNKQYCILNKQYTKESFDELRTKIIEHMNSVPYIDKKGRAYKYGEFFPPELSPFAYNETIAQEYFPLTKERAIAQGYKWKEPEPRNFQFSIINSQDLPDHIKDVTDDILNQVIGCEHVKDPPAGGCNEQCTTAFKIIKAELEFYRKMNLPLPRLCPNCRHYQRIKQRNPLRLWHRKCMCQGAQTNADLTQTDAEKNTYQNTSAHFHGEGHCENEFQTTYSPERPEIVYCEQCYNQEIV